GAILNGSFITIYICYMLLLLNVNLLLNGHDLGRDIKSAKSQTPIALLDMNCRPQGVDMEELVWVDRPNILLQNASKTHDNLWMVE
ncbi:hypothetical protein ACJX0J_041466, partial [Zea mays]